MRGDIIRKYNEAALSYAKKKKSEQTGFIHLFYHPKDDQPEMTIPLLENVLYAWALLRSKTAENILEAKAHLEKLLPFQTEEGFPVYLHEFPQVKDRVLCFHLFAAFAGILQGFQGVLGQELKSKIEKGMSKLFGNCQDSLKEFNVPMSAQVRAACAARDEKWLAKLAEKPIWQSPSDLGIILSALYTFYPRLSDSPWKSFWEQLQNDWHAASMSYLGPSKLEFQNGFEPQATLFDMIMGVAYGKVSKRSLSESHHLLQAPWVTSMDEEVQAAQQPFQIALEPLRCYWGSLERTHSLVCLGGNCRATTITRRGDEVEILFDLDVLPETEDKEKLREIVFYLDYSDAHSIRFNGANSTTFQITDLVEISSPTLRADLRFEVVEGSGQWMGHLMRGNRPNQIATKGSNRFQSYDWQIILRTLRRTAPCKIACRLTLHAI